MGYGLGIDIGTTFSAAAVGVRLVAPDVQGVRAAEPQPCLSGSSEGSEPVDRGADDLDSP